MKEKSKSILTIISFLTSFMLLIISTVSCIAFYNINSEAVATIASYNGIIYAGNQNSNKISLMINVYWGDEFIDGILETLKKHNAKTTFFLGGTWVNEHAKLAEKIKNDGHEIASHATTHADLGKLDYSANYKEISTCHDIVTKTLGISMNLLAPPSGSYNKDTIRAAETLGYKTIMWTRDTIDWRDHDTSLIYSRAISNMQGGDLVLMHPTKNTLEALDKILSYMKEHNFVCTTVTDNIT